MASESVRFEREGRTLAGRLDQPAGPPRAYALFAHCFTCGKDLTAAARLARALTEDGFAVLRFDFTGLGGSEGDFGAAGFGSDVEDLVAAADHLRARYAAPSLLVGHSLGGAAALAAASRIPEAKAVVTIGAPASPAHVERLFSDAAPRIEAEGQAEVEIAGRRFSVTRGFLEDLRTQQIELGRLGRALLVLHAPLDEVVSVDEAAKIYRAAKHPKSFVSLDGADHLLSRAADAAYAARVIAAWASRYLPGTDPEPAPGPGAGAVRVENTGERYRTRIEAGPHRLVADEPTDLGGEDLGPGPYDLLLASLGACTAMTLRMYADRKKIPLETVRVELDHEREPAKEPGTAGQERLRRRIHLEGPLDDATRARLLEIAGRCPVHRTLEAGPTIVSELLGSD